jgi:hypothetical protein
MDSTLWGVVVGAASALAVAIFTQLATFVTNVYAARREDKKWFRERRVEARNRNREEKKLREQTSKAEQERINEIYLKSIECLGALSAREEVGEDEKGNSTFQFHINGEKRASLITEANSRLALLSLRHPSNTAFQWEYEMFASDPDDNAKSMWSSVIELAKTDKDAAVKVAEIIDEKTTDSGEAQITFYVDNEFRKASFIESGEQVTASYTIHCKLADLSERQRQLLVNFYHAIIPEKVQLSIPAYHHPTNSVLYHRNGWKANLDPQAASTKEILDAWEKDCEMIERQVQE